MDNRGEIRDKNPDDDFQEAVKFNIYHISIVVLTAVVIIIGGAIAIWGV